MPTDQHNLPEMGMQEDIEGQDENEEMEEEAED